MNLRPLLYALLVVSLCSLSWREVDDNSDPLSKPTVWQKLTQSPSDSSLWSLYVGKPWVCMTYDEKENIGKWKDLLRKEVKSTQKDKTIDPNSVDEFWGTSKEAEQQVAQAAAAKERKEIMDYLYQLEQVMVQEPSFLTELKTNVGQNFVIIEDTYREEFMALGIEYKDYKSTYPNGGFPKQRWVAERGKELQSLKRKEFEKIKSQMLAGE